MLLDNAVRVNFDAGFKSCGLPYRGTHIIRHTAGTLLYEATGNLGKVQVIMGHTKMRQTEQYAKADVFRGNDGTREMAKMIGL
jgi:integrase